MENYKFQVNLAGIIDILANHLYSDEAVFVRELLQNATDAITARKKLGDEFEPSVEFELLSEKGSPLQIIISDNGIGLSVEEVHAFLSVIGASSKKDELLRKKDDFIGQFGIGLLSCFVIADEIIMISQSAKQSKAVEWTGKADGTYTIQELEKQHAVGTRIFLTVKEAQQEFFENNSLKGLLIRYGNFLKYPIFFSDKGSKPRKINKAAFPWESKKTSKAELIKFAETFFEMEVIDCIPLEAAASGTTGYAFISAAPYALGQEQHHSVYLHRMFLSDNVNNLLPEWVFFAKCIINSTGLRPTASRESFFEDDILKQTREQLGRSIIDYFYSLKINNPALLNNIINRHHIAMKLAAISNDNFFENIYSFIPFETNYGNKTIQDLLDAGECIKYVTDTDEFSKIAPVALNQAIEVVNAGYVYEAPFFEKLEELFPEFDIEAFDAEELISELKELELDEQDATFDFLQYADKVLKEYSCKTEIRSFQPANLSAIYFKNEEMDFIRKIEKTKDVSDELWGSILDNIAGQETENAVARICFNYNSPVIKKAVGLQEGELLTVLVKMLYVQALLTGRHPLHQKEMNVLTGGLYYLLEKITGTDEKQ
ncbi:MAG: HSP90 family protein [Ferruginibacter sp.]